MAKQFNVLMLGTPRARSNGPAFIAGWTLGLATVGTVVLLASSGAEASEGGQPPDWVNALKLALGALLLLVAAKQWRGRPQPGEQVATPKWMTTIDMPPRPSTCRRDRADRSPTGSQAAALAVFVLIGTIGTGAPVAIYFALSSRSARILDGLKTWMGVHNAAIMSVLCLVIGAKLIGDGISGF